MTAGRRGWFRGTLRAVPVLLLLAPGCASVEDGPGRTAPGEVAPPPAAKLEDEALEMARLDFRIEADDVRVQVPERLGALLQLPPRGSPPPWEVRVRNLVIVVRELFPRVDVGGEDFWITATGGVRTERHQDSFTLREGPYQTLLLRNGRLLRR